MKRENRSHRVNELPGSLLPFEANRVGVVGGLNNLANEVLANMEGLLKRFGVHPALNVLGLAGMGDDQANDLLGLERVGDLFPKFGVAWPLPPREGISADHCSIFCLFKVVLPNADD